MGNAMGIHHLKAGHASLTSSTMGVFRFVYVLAVEMLSRYCHYIGRSSTSYVVQRYLSQISENESS